MLRRLFRPVSGIGILLSQANRPAESALSLAPNEGTDAAVAALPDRLPDFYQQGPRGHGAQIFPHRPGRIQPRARKAALKNSGKSQEKRLEHFPVSCNRICKRAMLWIDVLPADS